MSADSLPAEDFFLLLGALLETRQAALKRRCTVAFAVVDAGAFVLDTSRPGQLSRQWRSDADVSVVCNRRTLSDIARGCFDMQRPEPEHLFLWGGDRDVWTALAAALAGGKTAWTAQLESLRR